MKKFALCLILILPVAVSNGSAETGRNNVSGVVVESVRKDNIITVISDKILKSGPMLFNIEDKEVRCTIITSVDGSGKRFLVRVESGNVPIRAGMRLFIRGPEITSVKRTPEKKPEVRRIYCKNIVSKIDKREMTFIDPGFFYVGSDSGDEDEKPRHVCYLDGFYIDTYEVTCGEYLTYVKASKGKYPRSWNGKVIDVKDYDMPVLVSYSEAERYAEWSGKSIPTEEEWEKSASASSVVIPVYGKDGYSEVLKQTLYPWGDQYKPDACICADFWNTSAGGLLLKQGIVPGPLPVHKNRTAGVSAFGLVDMAGNLPEWTSSWYQAYKGNTLNHFRFGTQVKVIKGGGWYSSRGSLRASSREYGGIPNLDEDAVAGFRCVKRTSAEDYERFE